MCADLTAFGEGRRLDDDGQLLLRYANGARGVIIASQVAGLENDLRLQVSGPLGTVIWRQEEPNQLLHAPLDGPKRLLTRGSPWLCESARLAPPARRVSGSFYPGLCQYLPGAGG